MYVLKRFKRSLVTLLVICIVAGFGFVHKATVSVSSQPVFAKTVIIDPGHGGFDGGAGADDGTLEKDVNLEISLKLRDLLKLSAYNVVMTRTEDTGTEDDSSVSISSRKKSDIRNRLSLMHNDGDTVYVSIHLNKFTTSAASGTQVFYTPNFDQARMLAEHIQKSVISLIQPENHRTIKQGNSSAYLLKNAKVPAVIVECGFLSNKGDLEKLKSDNYQSKLALCIAKGIMEYYKNNN